MMENATKPSDSVAADALSAKLTLPCGLVLRNRIVKSAMSDGLGDGAGRPTHEQVRLYERWADGGAALAIIGEVQVDACHPENAGNLVLADDTSIAALRPIAEAGSRGGAHIWPQLGHAGALTPPAIGPAVGPSPLDLPGLTCIGMMQDTVAQLPEIYAAGAARARAAGFSGVQIHAGHGFLLSQFLSPLFNRRDDAYGGSIAGRGRIVLEIISAIRRATDLSFAIGIKINSSDQLEGGLSEEEALAFVDMLDGTSVDLIDISGGTYFPGATASSDRKSTDDAAFFSAFAKRARKRTDIPLMLTGGITGTAQADDIISSGTADAVGLARAMVLDPTLPRTWLSAAPEDPAYPVFDAPVKGGVTAWYTMRLAAIGEDRADAFALTPQEALAACDARDQQRNRIWRGTFFGQEKN
ncbi:MAG: oxidoreductase [Pseudomonadota bacterium]